MKTLTRSRNRMRAVDRVRAFSHPSGVAPLDFASLTNAVLFSVFRSTTAQNTDGTGGTVANAGSLGRIIDVNSSLYAAASGAGHRPTFYTSGSKGLQFGAAQALTLSASKSLDPPYTLMLSGVFDGSSIIRWFQNLTGNTNAYVDTNGTINFFDKNANSLVSDTGILSGAFLSYFVVAADGTMKGYWTGNSAGVDIQSPDGSINQIIIDTLGYDDCGAANRQAQFGWVPALAATPTQIAGFSAFEVAAGRSGL